MTDRKNPAPAAPKTASGVPVATIYQNSDQVAGILQQLFGQPLIVEETRDSNSTAGDEVSVSATASASGDGGLKLPLLGALSVKAAGDLAASGSWTSTSGTAARQQFVYSQAYYLHLVRQQLAGAGNLHQLNSVEEAKSVEPGAFVEYTTSFDPVELTLALEVITPELVEAIAQWTVRNEYKDSYPEGADFEGIRVHAEKMRIDAESKGAFARAIATAVQADARQGTTREYYGRIAIEPALTAITVCEREHFITGDPDRLLDGTFTVFGKVISGVEDDVPTFARNKLLRNFSADAFDQVVGEMRSKLSSANKIAGMQPDDFLDLKLDSRVRGKSLRVLPLAIFS
jgi:cyclophilin family peptidyl-prolyl cis-trans isomerase